MSFKIGFSAEPERKQNYPDITAPKEHKVKAKKSVVDVFFPIVTLLARTTTICSI